MNQIADGKLAPFPGGVLIKNHEGKIVGAVGCSGATADQDEYCAMKAVQMIDKLALWETSPKQSPLEDEEEDVVFIVDSLNGKGSIDDY